MHDMAATYMEPTEDGLVIDEDELRCRVERVHDVAGILEQVGIEYVATDYEYVLLGAETHDMNQIRVLTEPFDDETANELATAFRESGFVESVPAIEELSEMGADAVPLRIDSESQGLPAVELAFVDGEYDRAVLEHALTLQLPDESIQIGTIELQIAHKLCMGSSEDIETVRSLVEIANRNHDLRIQVLESYAVEFGVEVWDSDAYDQLRS